MLQNTTVGGGPGGGGGVDDCCGKIENEGSARGNKKEEKNA